MQQHIETISRCLKPAKDIPIPLVIKTVTGFEVLAFDPLSNDNKRLLIRLNTAAQLAGKKAFEEGMEAQRPNEAGIIIERHVLDALDQVELRAETPFCKDGSKKTSGYPDIQIEDEKGRRIYVDCKTYDTSKKNSTIRTFYFSPSENPKITKDAFHFLMSFELNKVRRTYKEVFIPVSWQIYSLESLFVQLKYEFNANNRNLYSKGALLIEGRINNIKSS